MQQVMAELQQVGALDPAAQEKLMADLRQTEPGMWPLVLQQFRAAAAYRRQTDQHETTAPTAATTRAHERVPSASEAARPVRPSVVESGDSKKESVAARCVEIPETPSKSALERVAQPTEVPPAASPVGELGGLAAPGPAPAKIRPPELVRPIAAPRSPAPKSPAPPPGKEVVRTSHESPVSPEWQAQLAAAIRTMESQTKGAPKTEADLGLQARLRMLYLLAGRREDAMQPIPTAPAAFQDFWSKELYGLSTWLDTERTPDSSRRAAETKRILNEAIAGLSETAPLVVRNLAFCTSVQSYGSLQPFKKNEFAPDQEVLLYAEVDNFVAESTPKGYHTSLKSSYQILDNRGQRVADHQFAVIEENCQNARRDFFIGYHLRLPKRLYSGKHSLQLTVEDLKSHKVGQSTIDFTVKGEE